MTCRYTYKGKTYEAWEFEDVLKVMSPTEASAFMPSVKVVPDAPFIQTTDAVLTLALKRVITMAAQEGYDRVAFVNGEQSADRYDLSKQIDELTWYENKGRYELNADGNTLVENIPAEKLPDYVGKDLAERIVREAATKDRNTYSGLDLKVGGEGMKAFYDKIVPNAVNALLKKLGGGNLDTVGIDVGLNRSMSYEIKEKDDGRFALRARADANSLWAPYGVYDTKKQAEERMSELKAESEASQQPGFTITPAMREKAAGGLPLFAQASSPSLMNFRKLTGAYGFSKAKADAEQMLGIQSPVPVLTKSDTALAAKGVPMWYDLTEKAIYYNTAYKNRTRAHDAQWMSEEIMHAVDHVGGTKTLSLSSERFNEGGDLRQEIEAARQRSQVLQAQLDYPIIFTDLTDDRKAVELFARLGVVFKGFPEVLQVAAPKTYEVYRDIFSKLQSLPSEVQQSPTRDSGQEPIGLGTGRISRATVGQSGAGQSADSRLEQVRNAIVGAIAGKAIGRAGNFGGLTLTNSQAGSTIEVDGKQRPRNNSNGQPIAGTDEALRNFWRWFADSKAVDDQGRPLVVYHGTGRDVSVFNTPMIWVAEEAWKSSQYAEADGEFRGGNPNVIPVYMRVNRPFIVEAEYLKITDLVSMAIRQAGKRVTAEDANHYRKSMLEMWTRIGLDNSEVDAHHHWSMIGRIGTLNLRDMLSNMGFDGISYKEDGVQTYAAFSPYQVKSATGNNGNFDDYNGNILATVAIGGWDAPAESNKDRFIYELQDGRIDLKRAQENIKKAGGAITENFDARLAETLYAGRVARRTEGFIETEARPLIEAMARNNVSQEELGDYLHARHAPEANKVIAARNPKLPDGGAGTNSKGELMTTAAAEAYIAAIRPARKMVLDAMAKRVDAITKGTRQLFVNEGLATPEEIKGWESLYKSYVPLFKDEALEGAVPHPLGTGFNVRGPASKQRMGSEKEVTNILAHVLMQREAALTRAEKNRVGLSLYGLALSNPNPAFWTTIKPSMKEDDISDELEAIGVDPSIAQEGMRRAPTIQKIDPATGKVATYPNPMYKSLPNAITVKVNGQDRVLLLNASNPRALRMAENLKNLDGLTKFDIAQSIVGKTTRWMASVNTQYNPAFGLVNVTRDILGAGVNLGSTQLRGDSMKVMANTIPAMQGIARDLAGNDGGEWGKLWRQFQDDGGRTGYRDMFREASDRARDIEKELKNLDRSAINPAKMAGHALDLLDGFNTTLENAVRVSAYKAALDKGMSRAEAARLARELTVDFNRKGRAGREIGPLYAFFNASVQGTERTLRTLAGPTGGRVIAGGLTLGAMQALILLLAGYDDDEIPEWVKTRNLIIPTGKGDKGEKTHILIPMPLGLHVIPNTGRIVTEMILNGGKKAGKRSLEAIGEIASAFNPIGGGNIFTADGALKTIAPTVLDPLIELGANKNFMGAPIEKSYDSEKDDRPGYARARESTQRSTTGQAYIGISKAFNWATGGDQYEAGVLSPSPEKIRYLAQVAGGGVLRELEKTIDSSVKAYNGEDVKKSGIPILGRFSGETDDQRTQQARFFKNSAELSTLNRRMKAIEKAGDAEAYEKLFAENPKAAYAKSMNTTQRKLSELNRLAVSTVDDKEQIKAIDEARTELMRSMNDIIIEQEKSQGQKPGDKLREAARPVLEMVE